MKVIDQKILLSSTYWKPINQSRILMAAHKTKVLNQRQHSSHKSPTFTLEVTPDKTVMRVWATLNNSQIIVFRTVWAPWRGTCPSQWRFIPSEVAPSRRTICFPSRSHLRNGDQNNGPEIRASQWYVSPKRKPVQFDCSAAGFSFQWRIFRWGKKKERRTTSWFLRWSSETFLLLFSECEFVAMAFPERPSSVIYFHRFCGW